jgi:hypothetical protein
MLAAVVVHTMAVAAQAAVVVAYQIMVLRVLPTQAAAVGEVKAIRQAQAVQVV